MAKQQLEKSASSRPPIVVMLGHVDHGKTTLLDKIRNTSIQKREAGGITQSIGASVIVGKQEREITFIDTPGHSAFSEMRSRGAQVADIAILVIASDDSVMPQTKEALEFILQAGIPFIVCATKIDLPAVDLGKVKQAVEKEGIILEEKGGEVPLVAVSGKTGKGIDELLEMIHLVWDLNKPQPGKTSQLEAFVFESGKDKKGNLASVVVKAGVISQADNLVIENQEFKVRAIFDWQGKRIEKINPGYPGQLIGLVKQAPIGSKIYRKGETGVDLEKSQRREIIDKVGDDQLPIVVKAHSAGGLEAVLANLPPKTALVFSGVGDVTESDVFVAKSAGADIYVFEAKVVKNIKQLAKAEKVSIYEFNIIYHLFEKIEEELKKGQVIETGVAQIMKSFPFNNKKVAGCRVVKGVIKKNDRLILETKAGSVKQIRAISIKKGKEDIDQVKQGEEFGIIFSPQLDFTIGDMIKSLQSQD